MRFKVWFKNRRAKWRKQRRESDLGVGAGLTGKSASTRLLTEPTAARTATKVAHSSDESDLDLSDDETRPSPSKKAKLQPT